MYSMISRSLAVRNTKEASSVHCTVYSIVSRSLAVRNTKEANSVLYTVQYCK